jgi:hypothetical protein
MMLSRRFWQQIDADQGDGVLLAVLFKSWRRVADELGMDAIDIGSSVFEALCRLATDGAEAQARLSMTVFAAYWPAAAAQQKAMDFLGRWLPIDVASHGRTIHVECDWRAITRFAGEAGPDLYGRTQRELASLVDRLPEQERYPALPRSWDEVAS